MFIGLKGSIFHLTGKFWRIVYQGQLLSLMIRPVHPLVLFLLNGIRLHMLFPPLPIIIFLLYQGRKEWTVFSLLSGFLIVLIAVIMASLVELSFSLLSFWITKMKALDEIVDSFVNFTKYPLTVFHYGWQIVFTIIFPFMFYSTIPSFVALTEKTVPGVVWIMGLCSISIWIGLLNLLWKKGLKQYDGYGG
jgi:ABC-2 type transport system permease protein